MKFMNKLLATCLSVCVLLTMPAVSASAEEYEYEASSVSEAADRLREGMCARINNFSVTVPVSIIKGDAITDILVYALSETGKSTEGDYLRWNLSSYGCKIVYNKFDGTYTLNYDIGYNSTAQQEKLLTEKLEIIKKNLSLDGNTNYEKIKKIYGYIVNNVNYATDETGTEIFSAYGAGVDGEAVCQGYSLLMYRLLTECDVPCRIIPGTGNSANHAWNIAEADGTYYFLDSTWDSQAKAKNFLFFMRGSEDMDSLVTGNSHTYGIWSAESSPLYDDYLSEEFAEKYPISEYAYDINSPSPEINLGDVDMDGYIDSSDASAVLLAYSRVSTGKTSGLNELQKKSSDVDGNKIINSSDASVILSYYSNISTGKKISIYDFVNGN